MAILTKHSIVGTLVGIFVPWTGLAQVAAFFSHFLVDACPHPYEEIDQLIKGRWKLRLVAMADLIGAFLIYGLIMIYWGRSVFDLYVFSAGVAACLPDLVKLFYFPRFQWFTRPISYLHKWAHYWQKRDVEQNGEANLLWRQALGLILFTISFPSLAL